MSNPTQIGRYYVVGHLASGGMAEIFLGKLLGPSGFERPVVIKRILPNLARQKEFVEMFLDEARVVSRIHHPNVVLVHDLGQDDDLFMVMEYLEGETVASLVRRAVRTEKPLDRALGAHIVAEACAGLHAAHELLGEDGTPLGLVHRDVSPSNVFVTYGGAIKLLDFGIAKFAERSTATEAGLLKGKFAYMSPEQCLGRPLDRRSDIFALGIVLFELTTGTRLFARPNSLLTMKAITEEPIASPSKVDRDYPPVLARICERALSRDPTERYATAVEMRLDLVKAVRELAPDVIPEMVLADTMKSLFSDRVALKADLLRRVSAGSLITSVPVAEVDVAVELPTVTGGTLSPVAPPAPAPRKRTPPRALLAVALGVVLVGFVGGVIGVLSLRDDGAGETEPAAPETHAAAAPQPAAEPAPVEATPIAAPAEDAPEAPQAEREPVTLAVSSTPAGASVEVDGTDRGETPLALTLPAGDEPVVVRISARGFAAHEESFVPREDGRVEARLRRARARARGRTSEEEAPVDHTPAPPPPQDPPGSPFRRFN